MWIKGPTSKGAEWCLLQFDWQNNRALETNVETNVGVLLYILTIEIKMTNVSKCKSCDFNSIIFLKVTNCAWSVTWEFIFTACIVISVSTVEHEHSFFRDSTLCLLALKILTIKLQTLSTLLGILYEICQIEFIRFKRTQCYYI